jgi:hypothetical protein
VSAAWVVFRKELKDALRDRRTWLIVIVSSMLAGPLSLLLLARLTSSISIGVSNCGLTPRASSRCVPSSRLNARSEAIAARTAGCALVADSS